ncbi:hypothetical protein DFAR_3290036 [Desulfarculales bacterium]
MPPKPDAPNRGHLAGRGQGKRRPSSMIFLTQAATKSTMAIIWQRIIPVSRGQGCSTTLGHFFIPGSTPKSQDNGIKIPIWSSQYEKFLYFPIKTKQESPPLGRRGALDLKLAGDWGFSANWGLKMATLAEAWRRLSLTRICQMDLPQSYEHKHQGLSRGDLHKGLLHMTTDITLCILGELGSVRGPTLAGPGAPPASRLPPPLAGQYQEACAAEAAINGLVYDWLEKSRLCRPSIAALLEASNNS